MKKKMRRLMKGFPILVAICILLMSMSGSAYAQKVYWADENGNEMITTQDNPFDLAADGKKITLMAELPTDIPLNAFSANIIYNNEKINVSANKVTNFTINLINDKTPGTIITNGAEPYDDFKGPDPIPIIELTLDRQANTTSTIQTTFTTFTSNQTTLNIPVVSDLFISVSGVTPGTHQAYWSWTDDTGTTYSSKDGNQLTLTQGETEEITLLTEIPAGVELKACKFTLTYDNENIAVESYVVGNKLDNIQYNPVSNGYILLNGYDTDGVTDADSPVSLITLTIRGIAETDATPSTFGILVTEFADIDASGNSVPIQKPGTADLLINVGEGDVGPHQAYWGDEDGNPFDNVNNPLNLVVNTPRNIFLWTEVESVPTGKKLMVFNFALSYDPNKVQIDNAVDGDAQDGWSVTPNYETDGLIAVNGFSTDGSENGSKIKILDVFVQGKTAGTDIFNISVEDFGSVNTSGNVEQFTKPITSALNVNIGACGNEAYFAASGSTDKLDPYKLENLGIGAGTTIQLVAEVPAGMTLKVYKFELSYNPSIIEVDDDNSLISPFYSTKGNACFAIVNHNKETGEIIISGVNGENTVQGETKVALIELTVKGKTAGSDNFKITPVIFGTDQDTQCVQAESQLPISVGGAPIQYTLTFIAGVGGTISAPTSVLVNEGTDYTFTVTPNSGCSISSVTVGGTAVALDANNQYTISNIQSNTTIQAFFNCPITPPTYYITATAGSNGTISPSGTVSVTQGGSRTFTFTPDNKYKVADVLVNGVSVGARSSYTFPPVYSNQTIKVTFEPETVPQYTITVNPCDNGTAYMDGVLVDGDVLVDEGETPTFTFEADTEYVINNVKVDNISFGSVNKIVFTNPVTADHIIDVTCAKEGVQYTITATKEGNGTISPAGEILVNEGGTKTFTFVPDDSYRVADVLVDNVSIGKRASYTFTNVVSNRTIHVIFEPGIYHTITATAGANGTIDPAGEVLVDDGDDQTFTFIPTNENYEVADVLVDDVSVIAEVVDDSYTFVDVDADHTIHVTFEPLVTTYTITVIAGENGEIIPGTLVVNAGDTPSFIIDADEGYEVVEVLIDTVSQESIAEYTFDPVYAVHTIEATFATSLITAIAGDNGRITVIANADGSRSAVVFPEDGYKVGTVLVDGVETTLTGNSYLFNDGLAHTIEVTFIEICDAEAVFTATVEGLTATFNTSGSAGTLEFDYGDGTTGTETTHTYDGIGTYTVVLTATGSDDCTVTATKTVVVVCDAVAKFTYSVDELTATFYTSGSVGTLGFDYGDGTTGMETTHTYASIGTYTVVLTATGTDGCTVTATKTVTFVCDAVATFTSIVDGFTATFNTSGSVGTLAFNYGDGTIGTATTHTYGATGIYAVTLTATGTNGCTVTTTKTVAIVCNAVATFTYSTEELTATFDTSGSVGTLAFNYGDGATGTETTHTYANNGTYAVTLTATGTDGCTVTATKNVTVTKTVTPKYTISAPVSIVGGTINPSGEFEVNEGDSVTFTVTPYEGYELESVLVNNQSQAVGSDGRFTLSNITSDMTISVTFKVKPVSTYTIIAEAGDYGTIYPMGEIDVAEGAKAKFVFVAESGYEVADVLLNGVSIGKRNSYTFTDVSENATIYVTFKVIGNYITDDNGVLIPASKAVSDADKAAWGLTGISAIYTLDNVGAVGIVPDTGVTVKTLDYMSAMGIDNPDGKLMDMGLVGSTSEIATAGGFVEFTLKLSGDVYKPSQSDMPKWYQYDRDSNTIMRYPSAGEAGSDQGFVTFNYGSNGRLESVTLSILDGGEFDLDGVADGSVKDLSGYGIDMVNDNLTFETESLGDWKIEFEANATSVERSECVTWNFGDDSEYTSCAQTSMNGAITNPVTHVYAEDGTYTVTLIADGANGVQTISRTFTITNGRIGVSEDGGGDNCFISSASNSSMSFGSMVALMLMTLAGAIAVVFSRRVQ